MTKTTTCGPHTGGLSRRLLFWLLATTAFVVGFVATLSILRALSSAFNYRIFQQIQNWLKVSPTLASILLVAAIVAMVVAVWVARNATTAPPWRQIDFPFLVILTASVVAFSVQYVIYNQVPLIVLLLTLLSYFALMAFFAEGLARLRDRQMLATCYWLRFLRLYPPIKPGGFAMLVLLLANLALIFGLYPMLAFKAYLTVTAFVQTNRVTQDIQAVTISFALLVFALLTLGALTYLCSFLSSLADRFEKANRQKLRAEMLKTELITNVSHDIRTPLTSIINYVGLLQALPIQDPKFSEYVGVLDKKSARLKTLISDLIEASKSSTKNLEVHLAEIDLAEIIGQMAGEFDDQFVEKGLVFVWRLPLPAEGEGSYLADGARTEDGGQTEDGCQTEDGVYPPKASRLSRPVLPVQADNKLLWRVLENLFSNVAKYALPQTRVFADVTEADGQLVLTLKNTSREPLDFEGNELMEQFIRGDRARQSEGSGLGLYIAKNLVELMGGRLTIQTTADLFIAQIHFA